MTTQNWITPQTGDWSDAADWVSGVVPSSTDDAVIANSPVTVDGTAVADSLTLNASYLTVSGSLTLGTSLALDGSTLALSGGTLSAQSIITNNSGFLIGYGTASSAVIGDVDITAAGGTLKVQGSLAADQGNFTINGGAVLELSNGTAAPILYDGTSATLKLDAPTAFTGAIEDLVLGDAIDLAGITASSASYSGTTLTVNETNGQQLIYNNVSGSVAGDFVATASDNNGGTLVYWTQTQSPTVALISAATDNKATDVNAAHLVTITVDTSEVVNVTGIPTLQLNDNEVATYTKGTGTNTLTFSYTVQPGDNVADLQVTGLNLPSGAAIQDAAGNNLAGSVTGDLGIQIDTTPPAVTERLFSDTGSSSTDKITSNDALTGSGDPNAVVHFTVDGKSIAATATTNGSGTWRSRRPV